MSYRIRTSAYRALLLTLGVLLLSGATTAWFQPTTVSAAQRQASATLTSDKRDYYPGDVVTLTGSGWKPGELVTIVMVVDPLTHQNITLTAVADANGNFKNSDYLVQKTDLGVTFHVQATGASGDLAPLLTFTDAIGTPTSIGTSNHTTGNVGSLSTNVTSAVSIGNTIIVAAEVTAASSVTITVADSGNNTYTKDADINDSATTRTLIFSAPVTTALTTSSTITISFNSNERDIFVSAFQVSGLVAASRVDQTKTNTGTTSTALTTLAMTTTTQANDLLFAAFGVDFNNGSNPTMAAGAGYTALTTSQSNGVWGVFPEFQIVNATGAYTATGTLSSSQLDWSAALVAYKATLPATKLAFTSSAFSTLAGICSPQITVQSQNASSVAANPASTETIALTTNDATGSFYSNATCTTLITSTTIPTTASSASFFWLDTAAGTPTITATGTGAFSSAPTQQETVTVNPAPSITSLSPTSALTGASALTLTINGTGFVTNSAATYNGAIHTVTFVSAAQITIPLSAADLATAGTYPVVVTNPAPGGGISNTVNFQVNNPVPAITSLSPTSAIVGSGAQTLTINGTGFLASSTVTYNSVAHAATFVNTTKLTIALAAADVATTGTYPVVVTNPTPGGGSSAAVNFTVNNPVPTVTTLSPSSAPVGSAAQTLTINGTNFLTNSTATYNGVAHTVTFVSATQLTIPLTATDQATSGTFPVVVTNPTPGGGNSTAVNFSVTNPAPTITSLSPTSSNVGAAAQTLTINGTNFVSNSTATYNAVAHTATFVSSTQLTIQLTLADQATAGNFNVVVTNPTPGGGASSPSVFTVNNNAPTVTTLTPSSANVGAASQAITITGTNFVSTSTANYNGVAHTVTFTNATTIKITLTVADQAVAGTYPVVVTNPAPGGGSSTPVNFTVNNLGPTITSLSPASGTAGAAAQTLTINGTNFVAGSTVTYNSVAHTATFVSATKLTILLSAPDQATIGSYPVVVTNPAPGGGTSSAVNFVIGVAPAITSANTATFVAGVAGTFQVTATGNPTPTVSVTAGTLPSGLTMDSTGLISGTPAGGQVQVVTVTATNGISPNATQSLTIQVNESPFIDSTITSISVAQGSPISFQFVLLFGTPSTATWTETGALPAGVTLSPSGLLSGSAASLGNFPILVQADNGVPPAATENFTISVGKAATYTQPFNTGHGWAYTQLSCTKAIGGSCASNAADATAGDCLPAPCVNASDTAVLGAAGQTGYFQHAYTWVQLGVPSQATVVAVDGSFFSKVTSGCASSTAGMQIFDTTNTVEITSGALENNFNTDNDDSGVTHGNAGAKSVSAAFRSANTTVTLRFNLNPGSASFASCTLSGDNYNLTISYIPFNQHQVIFAKAIIDRTGHIISVMPMVPDSRNGQIGN